MSYFIDIIKETFKGMFDILQQNSIQIFQGVPITLYQLFLGGIIIIATITVVTVIVRK